MLDKIPANDQPDSYDVADFINARVSVWSVYLRRNWKVIFFTALLFAAAGVVLAFVKKPIILQRALSF